MSGNLKRFSFGPGLVLCLGLLFAACSSEGPQEVSQPLEVEAVVSDLSVSTSPDRKDARVLDTGTFKGDIYVFTARTRGVEKVDFYVDDPQRAGKPFRTESKAPFDLAGASGDADPLDTRGLKDGVHTVTAAFTLGDGGSYTATSTFLVDNGGEMGGALLISPQPSRLKGALLEDAVLSGNAYIYLVPETRATRVTYYLDDPKRAGAPYRTENHAFFDFAGTLPGGLAGALDTKTLKEGRHTPSPRWSRAAGGKRSSTRASPSAIKKVMHLKTRRGRSPLSTRIRASRWGALTLSKTA